VICKNYVGFLAIAPRRRGVATALMHGLSLAIRFTSPTGERVEIPPQPVQTANPIISITTKDAAQLPYAESSPNIGHPIFLRRGSQLLSCLDETRQLRCWSSPATHRQRHT
jgi:hypothetical protein